VAGNTYLNFDLRIERASQVPGGAGYRAVVIGSPAGETNVEFTLPDASQLAQADAPQLAGRLLFDAIFTGEALSCLRRSQDAAEDEAAGLRIRLRLADAPELANLPWEYLYDRTRDRFLALSTETPLVRYLELPEPVRLLEVKPPLRVLVVIASPTDLPALDSAREWVNLQAALGSLSARRRVTLERLEHPTPSALQQQLRQGNYHVLHFLGHGAFDENTGEGYLIFEDETGRSQPLSSGELGRLLADHPPLRLVLLNACQGAQTATSDPYSGAAQKLVQLGVPAIIAMRTAITDAAAIAFAREFYAALAGGLPVDAATSEARRAVSAAGAGGEWGVPVLFMRAADGMLWQRRQRVRLPIPAVAAAVTLFFLLAIALAAGAFLLRRPATMTGRFNVAVAEMGQMDAAGVMHRTEAGQLVSKWIFDELTAANARYEGGSRVELWHDSLPITEKRVSLGMIAGRTPEERAKAAAALTDRVHADVMIYGHLPPAGDAAQFVLEFYVTPRVRAEADATIGRYQLGDPIPMPAPFDPRDTLAKEALASRVIGQANGLFWLLLGLREDLLGRPEAALAIFQQAQTEATDWRERGEGKEILYFFIAREALLLKRYPEAEAAGRRALASNPDYARAQIVLGSIYLRQAQDLPVATRLAEPSDLERAVQAYQAGLDLARQGGDSLLGAIARLALALAYRLQGETYYALDREAEANERFEQAVGEIGAVLRPLTDAGQVRLAAQAYAALGATAMQRAQMAELRGDLAAAIPLYRDARAAFASCIGRGTRAPEDDILQSQVIAGSCQPMDKAAGDILRKLEGGSGG
jgi:hypothetical protein